MISNSHKIIKQIVIILLSLAAGYGASVHYCGKVWGLYTENYIEPLSIKNLLVFSLTYVFLFILLKLLEKHYDKICIWITSDDGSVLPKSKIFAISFAFLTLFWMPYLLSFAPASILGDSFNSIYQVLWGCYNNGMPIAYTLIIRAFIKVGNLCGSLNVGFFAYAITQFLVFDVACSSLIVWLYTHKVKRILVIITTIFYAVFPAFPAYAITMWKDPMFSIGLVSLSFILLSDRSTLVQLAVSVLVILFMRSNGIVIIIIVSIATLISKKKRIQGLICAVSIVFFILTSNALLNHFNAERKTEEALGIPLQQLAYTTVYDYESLSDDEIKYLDSIIPIETIKKVYSPCLVDSIKWNEQFNKEYVRNNSGNLIKAWIKLLPEHLESYIKAYVLETYGFWMPFVQSDYGYIDLYISENGLGVGGMDLFAEIFGISIKDYLANFKPYIGSGTLIWITLVGCILCILKNQMVKLWFYLPGVLCWLSVMISTPVAFSLRYVFVLLILAPVYILIPFSGITAKEKSGIIKS